MPHGIFLGSDGHPQLLRVGLCPDEHFAAARNLALALSLGRIDVFPLDQDMPQDTHLTQSATPYGDTWRLSGATALEEHSSCAGPVGQAVADYCKPVAGNAHARLQDPQIFPRCLLDGCDPPCPLARFPRRTSSWTLTKWNC